MSEHSTRDETERGTEPATTDTPPAHRGDSGGDIAQTDHSGHEQMFRRRFWISLILLPTAAIPRKSQLTN